MEHSVEYSALNRHIYAYLYADNSFLYDTQTHTQMTHIKYKQEQYFFHMDYCDWYLREYLITRNFLTSHISHHMQLRSQPAARISPSWLLQEVQIFLATF